MPLTLVSPCSLSLTSGGGLYLAMALPSKIPALRGPAVVHSAVASCGSPAPGSLGVGQLSLPVAGVQGAGGLLAEGPGSEAARTWVFG